VWRRRYKGGEEKGKGDLRDKEGRDEGSLEHSRQASVHKWKYQARLAARADP
jgi:hypothetical protein